ncbi:unnamed protein product [Ambrosiozyma monospora]|uniref:Unnamed protein product n=1 Tax=Ambrosiozyma monospora TaxID=43982 RepID=A0ACB5TA89_AMBMO|nr:unnamed protein product [Ambrosiozyma monospora]
MKLPLQAQDEDEDDDLYSPRGAGNGSATSNPLDAGSDAVVSEPPSGFNSSIVPTPQAYVDQSGQPSAPVTARKLHTPDDETTQQNSSSTLNQYATAHDFLNTAKADTGKDEVAGDTETIDSNIPTIHADNDFDESKKDIAGLDDINENSPAGKSKSTTDSETDFPSIDDLQFAEAEKRVSMTPGAFPSIDNDYPPLAEPEDDDDETSDDEFHDTVQTPSAGKKPIASSKLDETKAVKSPSFSDDFPQPSGAGFYNNPFSANAPQQQEPLQQQSSSDVQEKSATASTAPVNSNSANLFDDLGLEEATPEEGANFDNNADFAFSNNSFTDNAAFSFSQSNAVPTPAVGASSGSGAANGGNDDWEQLFAGFGNDPNLKPATTEKDADFSFGPSDGAGAPPPSYDFSSAPTDPSLGTASKKTLDPQPSAFSQRQSVSSYTRSQQLAIEELQGMGFDEDSVLDALKKNNWKLDMATNYLLDSA